MPRFFFKNPTGLPTFRPSFRPSLPFQIEASPIINSAFVPAKFGARFSDLPEFPKIPMSVEEFHKIFQNETGQIHEKLAEAEKKQTEGDKRQEEGEKKQAEREIKAKKFRHETRDNFQDMREKVAGKFDVFHGYKIAAAAAGLATVTATAVHHFALKRIELVVTQTNMSVAQLDKKLGETENRLEKRIDDGNGHLEGKISLGQEKMNLMYLTCKPI